MATTLQMIANCNLADVPGDINDIDNTPDDCQGYKPKRTIFDFSMVEAINLLAKILGTSSFSIFSCYKQN